MVNHKDKPVGFTDMKRLADPLKSRMRAGESLPRGAGNFRFPFLLSPQIRLTLIFEGQKSRRLGRYALLNHSNAILLIQRHFFIVCQKGEMLRFCLGQKQAIKRVTVLLVDSGCIER